MSNIGFRADIHNNTIILTTKRIVGNNLEKKTLYIVYLLLSRDYLDEVKKVYSDHVSIGKYLFKTH